ncbi:hypothetical protein AAG570_004449 [Ranatra chinensis]|uniref:HIG1 domain-containing protein n=1 Tax=Ranatra chinensis TaxID=642074 RepID=A0ABD0Y0X2_9HEMI
MAIRRNRCRVPRETDRVPLRNGLADDGTSRHRGNGDHATPPGRITKSMRVWIPCHSLANVQAEVADTASGTDWNPIKSDGMGTHGYHAMGPGLDSLRETVKIFPSEKFPKWTDPMGELGEFPEDVEGLGGMSKRAAVAFSLLMASSVYCLRKCHVLAHYARAGFRLYLASGFFGVAYYGTTKIEHMTEIYQVTKVTLSRLLL